MNQQPDKFFAEKLGGSLKPAPAGAWEKIEAGLDGKKNNKVIWLRIAASLLLISLASFGLWKLNNKSSVERTIAVKEKEKNESIKKAPVPVQPTHAETPETVQTEKVSPVQTYIQDTKRKVIKKSEPASTPVPVKSVDENSVAQIDVIKEEKQEDVIPVKIAEVTETVIAQNTIEEEDEAVTLVYNANEVNEKYLDKEALAKATSDDKKTSTFRKLLNKAYDLKTNSDPLGDLRQKKNEILALNFKSDKRSQNK